MKTPTEFTPRPVSSLVAAVSVDLSWLVQEASKEGGAHFIIDRPKSDCKTPRRNAEVEAALEFLGRWRTFCSRVVQYFRDTVFGIELDHGMDLNSINANEVRRFLCNHQTCCCWKLHYSSIMIIDIHSGCSFLRTPRQRLARYIFFSGKYYLSLTLAAGSILDPNVVGQLQAEERRTLLAKLATLQTIFAKGQGLISISEARLVTIMLHGIRVAQAFGDGVQSVEQMLLDQLIAAIGKVV